MKGRTVTAEEEAFHDLLCQVVGCIACRTGHGIVNTYCSVHHIDGRTKPHAHWRVLPLCGRHHQVGFDGMPGAFALHQNKARFVARYGSELELLARCIDILAEHGYQLPATGLELAACA